MFWKTAWCGPPAWRLIQSGSCQSCNFKSLGEAADLHLLVSFLCTLMAGMAECKESLWSGVWAASGPFLEQLHSKLRLVIMGSGVAWPGRRMMHSYFLWLGVPGHGTSWLSFLFFSVMCLDSKCETLFEKTTSNCDCLFMPVCFFFWDGGRDFRSCPCWACSWVFSSLSSWVYRREPLPGFHFRYFLLVNFEWSFWDS